MSGKQDIKEDFCGACVAGVGALVGAGTAGMSTKAQRKYKKTIFWIGIVITIISIIFLIYMLTNQKMCKSCSSSSSSSSE
jgi:hypothetical protein